MTGLLVAFGGHFYAYAPTKIPYAIDRYAMETKRQLDVLDKRLADVKRDKSDAADAEAIYDAPRCRRCR